VPPINLSDQVPVELQTQWHRDLAALAGTNKQRSAEVLAEIIARYAESHRHYHSVAHVVHVVKEANDLMVAEDIDAEGDLGRAIRLALWYHDAIYDVHSPTNEYDSAVLARSDLESLGLSAYIVNTVERLVMVTKYPAVPHGIEEAIVNDADLAILRAPSDIYLRYVSQVRAEYDYVSDRDWAVGRRKVMQSFLSVERIFHTKTASASEHVARANIQSELA
jgi:predicted metal-dependent HD superfamily phosphohydrolase